MSALREVQTFRHVGGQNPVRRSVVKAMASNPPASNRKLRPSQLSLRFILVCFTLISFLLAHFGPIAHDHYTAWRETIRLKKERDAARRESTPATLIAIPFPDIGTPTSSTIMNEPTAAQRTSKQPSAHREKFVASMIEFEKILAEIGPIEDVFIGYPPSWARTDTTQSEIRR